MNNDLILAEMLERATDWLWETAIRYEGKPHAPLSLNNYWQKCGLKQAYIGNYGYSENNLPYVNLTYHNFKHGGITHSFPSLECYQQIVTELRIGKTFNKRVRPVEQERRIQVSSYSIFVQAFINDKELWDEGVVNLPYVHPYLKSKGFTENIVDPSIRYTTVSTKNSIYPEVIIIARLVSIDSRVKGFQKIFPDGTKLLTAGMKKAGAFITLGLDVLDISQDVVIDTDNINININDSDNNNIDNSYKDNDSNNEDINNNIDSNDHSITNRVAPTKQSRKGKTDNRPDLLLPKVLLPARIPNLLTCEGVSTGQSVRVATGKSTPVIVTVDAPNIEAVVQKLREKYGVQSQCNITICADNDYWKSLEIDPYTNKPKPNTGLMKGHPVTFRYRCKIAFPNFSNFDTSTLPKDFNDLMQIAGSDEVRRQLSLAGRPDLSLVIPDSSLERERNRIRSMFKKHKLIVINERYMPDTLPDPEDGNIRTTTELIMQNKVTLMRCPIGTGKTTSIVKLPDEFKENMLYLCHLISLSKDGSNKLNIDNYTDFQGFSRHGAKITNAENLSICINSLYKLIDEQLRIAKVPGAVIMDEISQLLRSLTSMHMEHKKIVLFVLKTLVQKVEHIIGLDAHIDNSVLDRLEKWLPKERFLVILNEYQVGQGKKILFYENPGMIGNLAVETIHKGGRVFITTNSRRQAREIYEMLTQLFGEVGLYIASDSTGEEKVQAFFDNVNEEAKKYKFIITSPSITSGISIDEDIFDFVGGIFNSVTNTPGDALQAIGRVRKAQVFHVWVSDQKQSLPVTDKEIAAKWTETHQHDRTLLSFEDFMDDRWIEIAKDYTEITVSVTKNINYSMNDFYTSFIKLCRLDGYSLGYGDSSPEEVAQGKFFQAIAKEAEEQEYIESRVEVPLISSEEKTELKKKSYKTREENCKMDKREIVDFYRIDENAPKEVIEQAIIDDKRGKRRTEIKNIELALANDNQVQQLRENELKAGIDLLPDKRNFAVERELYQKLLACAGIDLKLNTNVISPLRYTADDLRETFVPYVSSHYLILKGVIPRLPKIGAVRSDPIRTFGTLLKRIGLKQVKIGRNENNQYCVDINSLTSVKTIIIRRGKVSTISSKNTANGKHNTNNILNTSTSVP
ncbi:MAG: plasmid replication protein, CyRepA1 family [Blastocatellia bacterium]